METRSRQPSLLLARTGAIALVRSGGLQPPLSNEQHRRRFRFGAVIGRSTDGGCKPPLRNHPPDRFQFVRHLTGFPAPDPVGEQIIDGAACWRIESTPSQKKISQYTRSEVWIRRDTYALAQIENYIKIDLVRRLKYGDFVQVQGIWTGRRLEMADLRRNSRTILTLEKLEYNIPLREEDFTLQALRNPL